EIIDAGGAWLHSGILSAMRTTINLSSRPFRNHRLLWMGILVVILVSTWSMMWVSAEKTRIANEADIKAKSIETRRKDYEDHLKEEELRKQQAQTVVISDSDRYQLAAARILLQRKSLSWTRMLSDLEHYVPNDTRVTGIKVESVEEAGKAIIARLEV